LIKLRPEQQEEESRMHDRSRFASREVTPTCISWSLFFLIIFQIVFFFFLFPLRGAFQRRLPANATPQLFPRSLQ
jgi:hypothetical protein